MQVSMYESIQTENFACIEFYARYAMQVLHGPMIFLRYLIHIMLGGTLLQEYISILKNSHVFI